MNQQIKITHFYHSGFSVEAENLLFVFDYWRGEHQELHDHLQLLPEELKQYRAVYVFISHEHMDHLDPVVFSWKDYAPVSYYVSSDMPVGTRGKRMAPGDTLQLEEGIFISAFDSTDLGVSFLLNLKGIRIFHAGDLNFWHWREESSLQEIEEAEREFQTAVRPLQKENIDVACFPVDPRQGSMFQAGADYFILAVKPRLLIPMHYFHRSEIVMEYARIASCRTTEVLTMPGIRDSILLTFDENGYMNISFPQETAHATENEDEPLENIAVDNPFLESDLPLSQLAENPENAEDTNN